ncbi:MAG: tetratricopeptide repeat protein [Nitrospira sp.]|nr:tetratricopeptide repeat protein [Nitrospira sp.]HBP86829.1 hypothetical protein [Nitrospiraceae bacterium]HNP28987.1 tetratricopeptide repeat protein [Nitrospirales bacterium]
MSIIADALQRLQARTKSEVTDTTPQPALVLPPRGKREPGWHRRPSPLKFWLVGIGMAIGLSGLGLGAYWIGLHLDFGMPTEASPTPDQRFAFSKSPPPLVVQPVDSPSSAATETPGTAQVENLPLSAVQETKDKSLVSQEDVSSKPSSPKGEPALPTPSVEINPVASLPVTELTTPTPEHPQQKSVAASLSTPNDVTDLSPKHQSTEPKGVEAVLPDTLLPQTDQSHSNLIELETDQEGGRPLPLEAGSTNTVDHVIDKASLSPNTTALTLENEEPQETDQATGSPQHSSAKWLHKAQKLILTGEYEEAQAMLSPLFHDPPVTWEPWFWMGTAYLGTGQLEQADQYFLSGLARNDKVPQLWIQRALVAQQQGSFQLAVHELRQAEALQPDLPHIHLNMGYAYERMGNNRLANQYFNKFLQLTDGQPEFFPVRKKLLARLTSMNKLPNPTTDNPVSLRRTPSR